MKIRLGLLISMVGVSVLSGAAIVRAQQAPVAPNRATQASTAKPSIPPTPPVPNIPNVPNADPLADVLFPPDLIMRHARELELTGEQKSFMRGEIQRTTTRFNELQWQLMDAMEALFDAMKASSVNEQLALTQLDKVLDTEREIKRLHISLGIRIKNQLTPEQQTKLQGMRAAPSPDGQSTPRPTE